jgi:hypothetical protein
MECVRFAEIAPRFPRVVRIRIAKPFDFELEGRACLLVASVVQNSFNREFLSIRMGGVGGSCSSSVIIKGE